MNIRPYHTDDQQQVIDLWQQCQLVVPWNDPVKDIVSKSNMNDDLFFVGESNKDNNRKIIASLMAGYDGHRGWLYYLAVLPECRKAGYARQMIETAEEKLKAKGCCKINLQVRTSNTQVKDFYLALDFKQDDVISLGKRLTEEC